MDESDKICDKMIKRIETVITNGAKTQKIPNESSNRSKSLYVWFEDEKGRVKLEIGSSVRPDPFSVKTIKSYIHEYLEQKNLAEDIDKFELKPVSLNVLNIERSFIDKIMSVKRHTICGDIDKKVRHIYDVTRLYNMPEIQSFLNNTDNLKHLITLTKETDSFYFEKRQITTNYDPGAEYGFDSWRHLLNTAVKAKYENLHNELLYTDKKQNFDDAILTFEKINSIFRDIGE